MVYNNGLDRVQDSLTALKATPIDSTAASAVAGNLIPEFASMKEFHAMRNLDPAQLTDGQHAAMRRIREAVGVVPSPGTKCQRVLKLEDMQKYFDPPPSKKVNIDGYFSEAEDVSDLNTVDQIREGLRLDYEPKGFVRENEVAIIEFDMPSGNVAHIPEENWHYPGTGNGFTGTRTGRVVPESRFNPDANIPIPEGTKLYWLDTQGEKVLYGTFTNGAWQ